MITAGTDSGLASARGIHRVFATTAFTRVLPDGRPAPGAGAPVHAKTMGTLTTLCGMTTVSWSKFYDVAFASVAMDRCPRCEHVLVAEAVATT
jgi:hypothetical protein